MARSAFSFTFQKNFGPEGCRGYRWPEREAVLIYIEG
jgi:hypothetical protein